MRTKAFTKVELVLVPKETQTDPGHFPDKEVFDTEYIRTLQVDERID